jgi:alkylhydroperoxidase family enzyme
MSYIQYTPVATLRPDERVADPDNIIQIHAGHPAVMRHHYGLYRALMHDGGPIPYRLREMIAVRTSALNHCRY